MGDRKFDKGFRGEVDSRAFGDIEEVVRLNLELYAYMPASMTSPEVILLFNIQDELPVGRRKLSSDP
jgi:hypothetical protein